MADPLLSPGAELLLKAYRQPLCDRIHLDTCILLDSLQSTGILTNEEAQAIQVRQNVCIGATGTQCYTGYTCQIICPYRGHQGTV